MLLVDVNEFVPGLGGRLRARGHIVMDAKPKAS
jgi:hypothetical protein